MVAFLIHPIAAASDQAGQAGAKTNQAPQPVSGRFRFPNPPHHYPPILLKPFSQKTSQRPYATPFAKDQEETFAVPQYFGQQPQPYTPKAATIPAVPQPGFAPGVTGGYPLGRGNPAPVGATNVQFGPSKASGNYFSPSTQDTSASGSYYANDRPSLTPMLKLNKGRSDYWGPAGSPFPKNLNSVPW